VKVREVVRALGRDGWVRLPRPATSHMQFKHPTKPGRVTAADHRGDLTPLELRPIERQSGVRLRGK
jgi:predicted RNA binding protein YcfA (HicA-like mRNA interferase family)